MNQPAATSQLRRTALRLRIVQWLGVAGLVLRLAAGATAQEQGASANPQSESQQAAHAAAADATGIPPEIAAQAGHIQYVGPDTYILLDEKGRPQPVPGMTYEDFLAAWKQSQHADGGDRERRYSIESIQIEGETRDGHARLRFTAHVHLLTGEPVDVPFGLLGAILQGEPSFTAAGNDPERGGRGEYLYFNPERGGFVVHLHGRAGELREIALDLIVPLTRDGTETTLPLNCPRSLASDIRLTMDKRIASAIVSSGSVVATEPTAEGGTRLHVAGAMGPVRLTWHAGDATDGEVATVLGAAGAVRVSVDGRSARSDARLTVQSYGGSFDRLRVRLPPGAQLVRDERAAGGAQSPRYRIAVEDDSALLPSAAGGAANCQVVQVQLPEKKQGPVTIELATEQPIGLEGGAPVVELGGFEVLGAVRQYGDVAVEVAGDWQARWDIGDYVRQVDPSELDASIQHDGLTATFQYDRQPWSLGVRITPRQFRVHATPQYDLEVLRNEARLTVRLAYQVFGTRAFEFHIGLEGWEMAEDPIDSGGLVDQDRIQVTPDDTLILPLAQSSSRRAEITFSVRRNLRREDERVRLPLPVPLADSVGTGELVAVGAADVELLPDLTASVGLTPTPVTEAAQPTSSASGPEHRFRTSLADVVFVADRINRSREVSVKSAADIEVQQREARIDQRFDFVVRYEPIKELHFEIPPGLAFKAEETEIVLLGPERRRSADAEERETPLSFVTVEDDGEETAVAARRLRVALPQPRLGQFVVSIRYAARPLDEDWNGAAWPLPLFEPAEGRVISQTASVRTPRTLAAMLDAAAAGSTWKLASAEPTAAGADHQHQPYVADQPESVLPLLLRAVDFNLPSSTFVERVWLQSWLSGDTRQDRAAFRFRTTASQLTIELPPQVPSDQVEVLIDAQPAELLSRGTGRILVRSPAAKDESGKAIAADALHTLELRSRQTIRLGLIRRHRLTPPQIVGTTALCEVYWQIVVPGDQHIVQAPARMTPASTWQWLGSFWGRRPILSQADLEQWAGASSQVAPSAAESEQLFTGLAPVSTVEVVTAPRWLIVLGASSAVLLAVLVWIYIPRAHRSWIVAALAALIAGLAIAFPAPALLLAQASTLGLVAASIAALIARLGRRRKRWPVMVSGGSSQRQLTPPRSDSILISPAATAASTAPTAPYVNPDSPR